MIKIFFLLALMSFPNDKYIYYQGVKGYSSIEECQENQQSFEEYVIYVNKKRGFNELYVETYCLEFFVFPSVQNKGNNIKLEIPIKLIGG